MATTSKTIERVYPVGQCWCGCEGDTGSIRFFVQGHDKRAESWIIEMIYGGVAPFLNAHGFGPNGQSLLATYGAWKQAQVSAKPGRKAAQ